MMMQALGLVWGNPDPIHADMEEIRAEIAAPAQYGARLLFEHWQTRQEAHSGFIVGRDVPSRVLAGVLRNLALYQPIDGMSDFRVRLAGTAYIRRFGRDITGLRLSELHDPANFEDECVHLANIVTAKTPSIVEVKIARDDRAYLQFEVLALPVLSPDRRDIWVLNGLFYSDWA